MSERPSKMISRCFIDWDIRVLPKRCCGDHFMVKNSCQSGLILLQENCLACYDHRGGDSPAALLFYGMVFHQHSLGSPYHRFSIAQAQQSSSVDCP